MKPSAARLFAAALLASICGQAGPIASGESGVGIYASDRHTGLSEHECRHCRLLRMRLAGFDEADPQLKYDPATGEDLRNYPPDRPVDFEHMTLGLIIPSMDEPVLYGQQSLRFSAIAGEVATISLDAAQLDIASVNARRGAGMRGEPIDTSFHHDGQTLTVHFDPPLERGQTATVDIDYIARDPVDGLFWTLRSEEWPGRPPQIHTQGQPETSRYWFPVHDAPNERLGAKFYIVAPNGFEVSANGELKNKRSARAKSGELIGRMFDFAQGEQPDLNNHTVWHYALPHDHPPYLTTLVVGKFAVEDVAPSGSAVRMPVYVPEDQKANIARTYDVTYPMLEVFETRFDEPYPWGGRYAQLVVWNFGAGGMENTAATTMFDTAVLDEIGQRERDLEGLIAHELAHMWFGDMLTCNSWEHIWLNEGWATYSESLWFEKRSGYQDGYLNDLFGALRDTPKRDYLAPGSEHIRPGMASPVYKHPWEVFRRASNPYPKGAAVLHMLRCKLGDETFFRAVARYVDEFSFDTVETDDFRKVLEDESGRSLEHFFDQWVYRPGTPRLEVTTRWDGARSGVRIVVEQTQRVDQLHPAFAFDLPIEVHAAAGAGEGAAIRTTIPVTGKRHELFVPTEGEPAMVLIDPGATVLADVHLDHPAAMLATQVRSAPTLPARIEAARALRQHAGALIDGKTSARVLEEVVLSDDHHAVRAAAAESLGRLARIDLLPGLFRTLAERDDEPRVLAAIATALKSCPPSEAAMIELTSWALDNVDSYTARANLLESLGQHATGRRSEQTLAVFERGLGIWSQHDTIRSGALAGLALYNAPGGLELAIPFTEKGNLQRLRARAIETVAELSHHDPHLAYHAIAPLLYEREEARVASAAIEALSRIEHADGLDALETFASATRHPVRAQAALAARDRLAAVLGGDASAEALQSTIERLERELGDLRSKFNERTENR